MSTSLILRRVKLQSTELAVLRALNADEIRGDPWNLAPRLLYTAERGDDAVLCIERLLDCDHPPLQTVANVVDYICQALEVTTCSPTASPYSRCWTCEKSPRVCAFSTNTRSRIARMAQKMRESCSKLCARGSMRQPTTHRFKFPRGTTCRLSSICLSYSVMVLRAFLQAILLYSYSYLYLVDQHFPTRRPQYLLYCTSRKSVLFSRVFTLTFTSHHSASQDIGRCEDYLLLVPSEQ